jgi:hypothetical protein
MPIMNTMRHTCIRSERRSGSSSASGPRQDLGRAVERHAEEVFDLLRRRPVAPAGREIGGTRHVGEGDNAAVRPADAELALSLERGACHRLAYVAGSRCGRKHSQAGRKCGRASRAPVRREPSARAGARISTRPPPRPDLFPVPRLCLGQRLAACVPRSRRASSSRAAVRARSRGRAAIQPCAGTNASGPSHLADGGFFFA